MSDDAIILQPESDGAEKHRDLPRAFRDRMWKPGQSGNPSGKPKKPLTDRLLNQLLANEGAETHAIIKAWLEKAKSGDIPAITSIRDTAEGKLTERNEHSGPDGQPIQNEIIIRFVK